MQIKLTAEEADLAKTCIEINEEANNALVGEVILDGGVLTIGNVASNAAKALLEQMYECPADSDHKPTDWGEAPEEVQEYINDLKESGQYQEFEGYSQDVIASLARKLRAAGVEI